MSQHNSRPPRRTSDTTREGGRFEEHRRAFEEQRQAVEEQLQIALERHRITSGRLQVARVRRHLAEARTRPSSDDRYLSPSGVQYNASGEISRAIDRFYHSGHRSGQDEAIPPAASSVDSMSDPARDLQRRFSREPQHRNSDFSPSIPSSSSAPRLPSLRSSGSRRGAMPNPSGPAGRTIRHRPFERSTTRSRPSEHHSTNSSLDELDYDLEDANSQLRATNSQLRAILDFSGDPIIASLPRSPSPPPPPQDPAEDTRRIKRRKLDSDRVGHPFKAFRYGRYGQVEPGKLKMEIASCDGGQFSLTESYAAENILKDDNSVYCTKGSRCNIVLRHQGGTVFSLKELVIKAPGSNYSSPVREGMVFISMEQDDLLTRTAQYQIQYVPLRGHGSSAERENRAPAHIVSIRHNEDGATGTRAQARARRLYTDRLYLDDDEEYRRAQIPSDFTVAPPPFRVTTYTDCSDNEYGDDTHLRSRRQPPNRIGTLPFESDGSEDGNSFGPSDYGSLDDAASPGYRRAETMTLAEVAEASQVATQEAVRAVGGQLMAPHARFFIERDKNKCTIRFDPPVSGRFILLKMWNPHHAPSRNIDILGVVAKGYAGPRFFPSVDLR